MDWIEQENKLTPHDKKLLLQARDMDWVEIAEIEDTAETQEGRDMLHDLRRSKYHSEECFAGME